MKNIEIVLEKVYEDKELRRTIVPLFISNPGLGKSKIITQFAKKKGVRLIELITSTMNPFEVSGIAMPDRENGKMTYLNFDNLLSLEDGDILFFDELLNGNPAVLNACLTILEQRKFISGKALPDIMIVAAANPQGAPILTPQIKERFVWYKLIFDRPMWSQYMRKKYSMPVTISKQLSALIEREDYTGTNLITPRSVDKAIAMMIAGVPTPYETEIGPTANRIIDNPLKGDVVISPEYTLKENERVGWLDLMKIIKKNGKTE